MALVGQVARMSQPPLAPGTLVAAITSAGLIAQQVAGKAVRDALFLSNHPSASLPFVMAGGAALSLAIVAWLSRAMTRRSPRQLAAGLLAASCLGLIGEWTVGFASAPLSAVLVYLHTTAVGPAAISLFWSLFNERFDPHAAKRSIGWIAAGGTFGGVLGALLVWRAASLVELPVLVLFLAALHGACVPGALLIRRRASDARLPRAPAVVAAVGEPHSALRLLKRTPFLRHLGTLVILSATMSALLDYVFNARAAAVFATGQDLLSFFALFWLAVSVLSLLFQVTLGRGAIERLPVAANIATLPGLTLIGAVFGIAIPGLVTTAILRGVEAVHHNTFFRSAYELLYTPINDALKRPTKALIDVGFDRTGTVVGSGIIIVTLALFAPISSSFLLAVAALLALAMLPVAWRLHSDYRASLEQALRDGGDHLGLPIIERGPSAKEARESSKREELVMRFEALRPGGLGETSTEQAVAVGPAAAGLRHPQALIAQATELLSGEVEQTRRALGAWPGESRPVVDVVIMLLAHPLLHRDATVALRRVAKSVPGQLIDALVDPAMDFVVRRRIPRVLVACGCQRAADGLVSGLRDERFEVRYECGRALLKLTQRNADIVVSRESVFRAISAETEKSAPHDDADVDLDIVSLAEDEPDATADVLVRDRISRSLEHVFTLLSLHAEREPLVMALRALHHQDAHHRGTALEYLSATLPPELRDVVWPLLGETEPLETVRSADEVLAALARAAPTPPHS